jgi:large subunit ribosomal protein L18
MIKSEQIKKQANAARRAGRVRAKVSGSEARPRITVSITNKHVSAQIIDDSKGTTLAAASSVGKKMKGSMSEKASKIGADLAKDALKNKISTVVLDKGSKKYHGRIKALADAAREGGLEF